MKVFLSTLFVSLISLSGYCDFASYFEIKLNQSVIYNSSSSTEQLVEMKHASLKDTDLLEIKFFEYGVAVRSDYELHIKVENTTVDLTFINDEPRFILNMGWLTQFKNKKTTIYFYQTKYANGSSKEQVHKVVDLLIAA